MPKALPKVNKSMNIDNSEIIETCRICLAPVSNTILSIFAAPRNAFEKNISINVALKEICPFVCEISESDCLPKFICEECLSSLKTTYIFIKKCCLSNEVLLGLLEEHDKLLSIDNKDLGDTQHFLYNLLDKCSYFKNDVAPENVEESVETMYFDPVTAEIDDVKIEEIDLNCPHCSKTFKTLSGLEYHKNTHESDETFHCPICEKSFFAQKNLNIHQRRHDLNYSHLCPECGKKFLTSAELTRHLHCHQSERPLFECETCSKTFTTNVGLNQHMLRHLGEKPKICDVCTKKFTTPSNLNEHKLSHLAEKPHKCKFCEKSWISTSDLKKHMRTHSGEKPYVCNVCDNSFARVSTLKVHERLHTGEKLFSCPNHECFKVFAHGSSLRKHKKKCDKSIVIL